MNNILVIDTSRATTAVGVIAAGQVKTLASANSRYSAQEVLPLIDQLLQSVDSQLAELAAIAVVSGPGSFTGLRIGVGVAQGLGAALDIPLLAMSSLALQAFGGQMQHGQQHWLVAELARDDEIYFAAYHASPDQGCTVVVEEQVCNIANLDLPASWPAASEAGKAQWAGIGSAWQEEGLREKLLQCLGNTSVFDSTYRIEDACALAGLEFSLDRASQDLLLPNYIKEDLDYS